jgi:hypothetical protein
LGRSPDLVSEEAVMRNLLALLGLLVVLFLGLGWYLDWYRVRPVSPIGDPGHKTLTIDVNAQKLENDGQKIFRAGEERLHELFDQETDRAKAPAEKKPANGGSKATQPQNPQGDAETSEPSRPWLFK